MRQSGSNVQMMHIRRLMESIDAGQISIPDFQRDFDWSSSDVKQLLITVFAGWPAGSLLLLDSRNNLFKARGIEGGPPLAASQTYSVLDGQQRLTSLYHSFYDKGDVIYAVAWNEESDEMEDCLRSYSRRQWQASKLDSVYQQAKRGLLPISALKTPSDFFQWRDEAIETLPEEQRDRARQLVTSFYKKNLSSAHDYEFPAVILESNLAPEAIARIFERVNRTGLKLDVFDLMVAKTFVSDWNLREQWQECRVRYPIVAEYLDDDGVPLLEAIALRQKGDVRKSAVLSLDAAHIRERWLCAEEAAASAVEFLRDDCGAIRPNFVPYRAMISLLIALEMEGNLREQKSQIVEWFVKASFDESFDVASNTRIVSHFRALDGRNYDRIDFDQSYIDGSVISKRNSKAIWAGNLCFLSTLTRKWRDDVVLRELTDAQLYTEAEIRKQGYQNASTAAKSILNQCLVPATYASKFSVLSSQESFMFAQANGFGDLLQLQLRGNYENIDDVEELFAERSRHLTKYVNGGDTFKTDIDIGFNALDDRF